MELIKEINNFIISNNEIPNIYNDLNDIGIESLIMEVMTDGTIEWEAPVEKAKIIKTSGEEKVIKRDPIPRKGSGVLITVDNNNIPAVISDIQDGHYIISYKINGDIKRLSPQPKEKFKFLKFNKSGNALFKLENKLISKRTN